MSAESVFRRLFGRSAQARSAVGIERGALYVSREPGRAAELAEVLDVRRDELGIGHVHFRLYFQYQDKVLEAGARTLAVPTFRQRFAHRRDASLPPFTGAAGR